MGDDGDPARQLTAFVSYRTKDLTQMGEHERGAGWHVPAALTQKIADAGLAWGRFPGADVYLSRGTHQIRTNLDLGNRLVDGLNRFGMAKVIHLRSEPRRIVSMAFSVQGSGFYQVRDDAHLEHANDLSDWVVEPLGGGKHLVQAKNLEPWYADPDPDPATLAKARADFGSMILTTQTVEDNPPPWD